MKDELRHMLKKVMIFDLILAVILYGTSSVFFKSYSMITLLGLILAVLSFVSNAIITQYSLLYKTSKYKIISMIAFIVRILVICGIALMLLRYNKFSVIAYIFGYSSHFISLILYGVGKENK